MQQTFLTNVVGPAYIAQAFLPLVEKSTKKTIVNVSSSGGSIASDLGPTAVAYSVSKAAMNMLVSASLLMRSLRAIELTCHLWRPDVQASEGEARVHRGVYMPGMAQDRSVSIYTE